MQDKNKLEQESSRPNARLYVSPERAELFLERLANGQTMKSLATPDEDITVDVSRLKAEMSLAEIKEEMRRYWVLSAKHTVERFRNPSPDDRKILDWLVGFCRLFGDLLPTHGADLPLAEASDPVSKILSRTSRGFLFQVQLMLREAWKEQNALLKEGFLMQIAGSYMRWAGEKAEVDRFLMVLLHALKRSHLLKYCANPECPEPYFVADRISQDYCSAPCAKHGQRESQLRWWHEHGDKRRKERVKQKRAKRRGKGK